MWIYQVDVCVGGCVGGWVCRWVCQILTTAMDVIVSFVLLVCDVKKNIEPIMTKSRKRPEFFQQRRSKDYIDTEALSRRFLKFVDTFYNSFLEPKCKAEVF